MARKATNSWGKDSNKVFPSKLYFIQNSHNLFGPYSRRPTSQLKKEGGKILEFILDERDDTLNFIHFKK